MPNIQRIVVPINGTAESFKALSLASDLAKIHQAQICLLLVTYFSTETDDKSTYSSWLATPLTGSVSHYVETIFTRAKDLLPSDINISTHHLSGQPTSKILEFTKTHNIDLIVMGCRKLSLFSSILNGSTSRQILEKSTCPIIIVK
ncbi:universal stress protein [uncultured Megamonas sp.]|uniref:universal stress protein n=1 Tax=uncultured Megamonas sp. TaxID=286140 RepID=UPI00266F29B7|nr:universal stress protein [uncultured Megamonas sp.]